MIRRSPKGIHLFSFPFSNAKISILSILFEWSWASNLIFGFGEFKMWFSNAKLTQINEEKRANVESRFFCRLKSSQDYHNFALEMNHINYTYMNFPPSQWYARNMSLDEKKKDRWQTEFQVAAWIETLFSTFYFASMWVYIGLFEVK